MTEPIMTELESFIRNLTSLPGVYSMLDEKGKIIYVGKAKNLKKRVSSYFQRQLDNKTLSLVRQIRSIQVTVTRNEREALLLESNLIKQLSPRYNVIFKDDKSFPYLYLSTQDTFPRLSFHRGSRAAPGKYFGPYPSAGEAREALNLLQTIFKLRQCDNYFFKSRLRPCLQYQIKRCTAPCVGYIDEEAYQHDVKNTVLFLEGKNETIIGELIKKMEEASRLQDYERAARIRDQIGLLRKIQEQQIIVGSHINVDIIGLYREQQSACIHLLVIREGRMLGSRHYFPKPNPTIEETEEELTEPLATIPLEATGEVLTGQALAGDEKHVSEEAPSVEQEFIERFIMQHYLNNINLDPQKSLKLNTKEDSDNDNDNKALNVDALEVEGSGIEALSKTTIVRPRHHDFPTDILVPFKLNDDHLLQEILGEHAGHKVEIKKPTRGKPLKWLEMAMTSAEKALKSRLIQPLDLSPRFESLQEVLGLPSIPERIECFDVSHTMGESTVASCVVFDLKGPLKEAYRRFNIKGVTPGDDYGALRQALTRRYTRLKEEGAGLPDILFIDGGKGQLAQAVAVLHELQVTGVIMLGVAKGPGRRPGLETIYRPTGEAINLAPDSKAMHLIQQIRDEAHRFAISLHRKQSRKSRVHSRLEDIPGVGKSRRLALLRRFGGLQEVKQATVEDLAKVPGINQTLAERIYEALHGV